MHLKSNNFYNHLLRIQESFEHMQGDEFPGKSSGNLLPMDSEPNEISRFEILRNELIELEMRVKRSTAQTIDDEVSKQLLLQDVFKCTFLV